MVMEERPANRSDEVRVRANELIEEVEETLDRSFEKCEAVKMCDDENAVKSETVTKKNFLDLTELIRSIQRAEGNPDCFSRIPYCNRMDCVWHAYCLGNYLF